MDDFASYPRLVGDVGGTNARFAWMAGPDTGLEKVVTLPVAEHAGLREAIEHYLRSEGLPRPAGAAIGIANPVMGDRVQMTNHDWSFSIRELQQALGLGRLLVLNDFTALALALPGLTPNERRQVGGGEPVAGAPVALLGAGTGLGVSGLVPSSPMAGWGRGPARWIPLEGEGGHVTLAATDDREEAVLRLLRRRHGHVSAERAVSGPGLENLYQAVCELDGKAAQPLDAPVIAQTALRHGDACCVAALELFCAFLGTVAGNLALTLGARGGVYIGGGIVPRLGHWFDGSRFRERFEAKGRFRPYLEAIPTWVVQAQAPGLLGAARALDLHQE
ncbi:MAG TPA: glucokinase [Burkholderiaceae bacterium]|nr:glucokinase [Burkholderiaceae bacterium]